MFTSSKRPEGYDAAPMSTPGASTGAGATVIARGVKVEGNFVSQGDVVIEGDVNGQVSTNALLTVGSDAKLKAEISAEEAVIAGVIEGTVSVKKRLELRSTAKIKGDISCETITVESGASLNGKMSVGQVKVEPVKAPASKTAAPVTAPVEA